MAIHPVIASLKRHKLTIIMLMVQVALTCAIVSNVASMVARRIDAANIHTGVDEHALSVIHTEAANGNSSPSSYIDDLFALRSLAGVHE